MQHVLMDLYQVNSKARLHEVNTCHADMQCPDSDPDYSTMQSKQLSQGQQTTNVLAPC
jgi:hypothetical protein